MKIRFCFFVGVWALAFSVSAARNVELFNDGWEFSRDNKNWQAVEVPHDWAIAGPFDPQGDHKSGKLPWKGIGFYRKQLVVDKPLTDRRVIFDFDGVMCDGTLYVNDQPCGNQPYAEDEGSELIDTHALTHLACLWYAVNDEADEENRAWPVLSSDEPVISTSR